MPDEIILRFSVKDDGSPVIEKVNKKLGETKKEAKGLVPGLESARESMTGFASANASLIGVLVGVGVALNKVIQDHLEYANAVRQQAALSGTNTEEASRYIQVLDDYKISSQDALLATRALTNAGHVPSIATLAELSDQYLALNSAEEKNAFVLKNLGRGGLQWIEVLTKGKKAILEQGAAIDKSLLLTQKMVDDARKAEIAVDNWNDSLQGLKTTLATNVLPHLTNFLNAQLEGARIQEILAEKGKPVIVGSKEYAEALKQAHEEQEASTRAMIENADATEKNTVSLEENKEALKAITEGHQAMLGLIGDTQSAEENYQSTAQQLNEDRIKIEQEKAQAISDGWWEGSEKIREYDDALAENTRKVQENQAEFDRANLEIISGLVERKLMQDGVLGDAEFVWLTKKREEWGLYSSDVVAKAQAAWQEADRITASVANIPSNKTITITTNHMDVYSTLQQTNPGYYQQEKHAAGGVFMIPNSYGNEGFRMGGGDTASGGEKLAIAPKNQNFIDYKKVGRALRDALVRTGG